MLFVFPEPTFDPSIANCDFESGFCQYSQDPARSQWRRVTVQPNLFRIGDHTTGTGEVNSAAVNMVTYNASSESIIFSFSLEQQMVTY